MQRRLFLSAFLVLLSVPDVVPTRTLANDLAPSEGIVRRDPSDIIRVDGKSEPGNLTPLLLLIRRSWYR